MRRVFADTAYWIALINPQDSLHARAIEEGRILDDSSILTSEMVLVEVLNYFAGATPRVRRAASTYVQDLRKAKRVQILPQTPELFDQAHMLYHDRPDKHWSFTDCSSMIIMQQFGFRQVLTKDHHFRQAGFETLLD